MNKEKKIIIIGIVATILALVIAGLIFYLIYNNSNTSNEKNNNNLSENIDTSTNTNNDTINNENNNNTTVSNPNNDDTDTPTSNNDSEKKVTVYLFRGNGCPHCEHAMEFLESIADDYGYLEIISYEVWYNSENQKLMEEVSSELGIEVSTSVPLIVIGTEYARRGYSDGMEDGIIREIESSYQSSDYEDVVEKVLEENDLNVTAEIIN